MNGGLCGGHCGASSGLAGATRTGLGGRPCSERLSRAGSCTHVRRNSVRGFRARPVRDGDGLSVGREISGEHGAETA